MHSFQMRTLNTCARGEDVIFTRAQSGMNSVDRIPGTDSGSYSKAHSRRGVCEGMLSVANLSLIRVL